jgi:hypothetical protein
MLQEDRLKVVAELIRDHISLGGIELFFQETELCEEDFTVIEPQDFEGHIYAVDGSNVAICSWSVANLNLIRAGYAVYRGKEWQKTVITYNDVFLADPKICSEEFDPYLKAFFGLKGIDLKESDLDRLSTYFRELQEYIALNEALDEAYAGDLLIYDGGFDVFEPLRSVLRIIFKRAEEKGVDLLGVSKSSSLSWGKDVSLPFVQHTGRAGTLLFPGVPWYVGLKDKLVDHGQGRWEGETYIVRLAGRSDLAFRVDVPAYLAGHIGSALCRLAAYSRSSECLGYPHALFRAHRDIRITNQEGGFMRLKLIEALAEMGLSHSQMKTLTQDFHDILEMRPGI